EKSRRFYPMFDKPTERMKHTALSDTVILTIPCGDHDVGNGLLADAVAYSLVDPFVEAMHQGFYLRGAVSVGNFHQSEALLIGPAVDEAAEWYEKADWIGVSAAPSLGFGLEILFGPDQPDVPVLDPEQRSWRPFVKYKIPTKGEGRRTGFALNWPSKMLQSSEDGQGKKTTLKARRAKIRRDMLLRFAGQPIAPSVLSKYTNTIKFFDLIANGGKEDASD
ncbi:MAG: hypothetical protein M1358_01445, partial [Chloroflexi bacterium]|nr:hypothetical protein [Chloroflexota bacterium]